MSPSTKLATLRMNRLGKEADSGWESVCITPNQKRFELSLRRAVSTTPFAHSARPAFLGTVRAIPAVLARMTRITSGAGCERSIGDDTEDEG